MRVVSERKFWKAGKKAAERSEPYTPGGVGENLGFCEFLGQSENISGDKR